MTRNKPYLTAGAIALFTTSVHVVLGQIDIVRPMLDSSFDGAAMETMLAVWHICTAGLSMTTLGLLAAGWWPKRFAVVAVLPIFIALHYVLWTVVVVVVALLSDLPNAFMELPQPILFLPIIVLTFIGARKAA
jgi:hypothetical protein